MKKAHSSAEELLHASPRRKDKNGDEEPIYLTEIRERINGILNGSKEFRKPLIAIVVKAALTRHGMNTEELRRETRERFEHMLKSRKVVLTDMQGTPIGKKRPASKKHKEPAVKRVRRGADELDTKLYNYYLECASEPSTLPLDHPQRVYLLAARRELGLPLNHPGDLTVQGRPAMSDEAELAQRMAHAKFLNARKSKIVSREIPVSQRMAERFRDRLSKMRSQE